MDPLVSLEGRIERLERLLLSKENALSDGGQTECIADALNECFKMLAEATDDREGLKAALNNAHLVELLNPAVPTILSHASKLEAAELMENGVRETAEQLEMVDKLQGVLDSKYLSVDPSVRSRADAVAADIFLLKDDVLQMSSYVDELTKQLMLCTNTMCKYFVSLDARLCEMEGKLEQSDAYAL